MSLPKILAGAAAAGALLLGFTTSAGANATCSLQDANSYGWKVKLRIDDYGPNALVWGLVQNDQAPSGSVCSGIGGVFVAEVTDDLAIFDAGGSTHYFLPDQRWGEFTDGPITDCTGNVLYAAIFPSC